MDVNHSTETITIVTGDTLTISSVGALLFPSGTTAQRPSSPVAGMQRFNTTLVCHEKYNGTTWNCNLGTDSSLNDLSDVIITTPIIGNALRFDGVNWVNQPDPVDNASTTVFYQDDFVTALSASTNLTTLGSQLNWQFNSFGAGSIAQPTTTGINSTDMCIGVISLETGIDAVNLGRAAITLGDSQVLFGYAEFGTEWRVMVNILATVANNYDIFVGFVDNNNVAADPVDGAYFEYDFDTSPNWIMTTSNNSVRTKVTSTVAVSAVAFQKLRIEVNATGTSAEFFINGTSTGTITTDIPTGAGRFTGWATKIKKASGLLNLVNRILFIDYASIIYTFTTPR